MLTRITSNYGGHVVMEEGDHSDWLALAQVHATLAQAEALRDVAGELAAIRQHLEGQR